MKHVINWVAILIFGFIAAWMASVKGYIPAGQTIVWIGGYVVVWIVLYIFWWSVNSKIVATLVSFGLGISWLISYLFEMPYSSASYIGWIIWSIIIGKNYKHFVIFPDDNEGIILQNNFIRPIVTLLVSADVVSTRGWRAVFAGFNLKWPWEVMIFKPIPLQTTTPLSGRVSSLSKDDKIVIVDWVGSARPIRDRRLVAYYTTEEEAFVNMNQAITDLEIQSITRENDSDIIVKESSTLYSMICEKLFGGDGFHKIEVASGRHIDKIAAKSVRLDDPTLRAKQAKANVEPVAETIERLRTAVGGDSISLQMAMAIHFGTEKPEILQFVNNKKGNNKKGGGTP
jgi:hypothetical protein